MFCEEGEKKETKNGAKRNREKMRCYTPVVDINYARKMRAQTSMNWHEAGHFYPPCDFEIGFCQLNLYQKFPNFFGGEK